jgi:undecaprenyl diphosphate synthase
MPGVLERLRLLARAQRPVEPELPDTARSVAIIMDGNARWARSRGLPVLAGHSAGTRALRRTVEACLDLGVDSLAVFAFSTENWNRPDEEVRGLLDLLAETIQREFPDMARMGVRVRFVGRRDRCSPSIRQLIEDTERDTAANAALTLWICFDYGGRAELVEAARALVRDGVAVEDVDERSLAARLNAPDMPEPDLVIRTSGEQRLSNFLLWQAAYAELYFSDKLWPDFTPEDLQAALAHYAGCQRRFGAR